MCYHTILFFSYQSLKDAAIRPEHLHITKMLLMALDSLLITGLIFISSLKAQMFPCITVEETN